MTSTDFTASPNNSLNLPEKRKAVDLLPGYLQSTLLKKFFGVTVDQWFQPAAQESVSGYIGQKSGIYYKPETDFYLQSSTALRNNYQLEPTVVSVDNNDNTNYVEFYQDIVDSLAFDGALVNNHSRLFSQEVYSWSPPINPDMFINFADYYWLQIGPQTRIITDLTNAVLDIIGKNSYITPSNLALSSGMRIQFTNDANAEYNNIPFIVEGVGTSIVLIDDSRFDESNLYDVPNYDTTPYDALTKGEAANYWTINRASIDKNPWSRSNRWFHKNVLGELSISSDFTFEQAHRPIIEFTSDLELRNFARYGRNDVKLLSTSDQILDIVGQSSYVIDDVTLLDGDTILFIGDVDPGKNNRIYRVFGIEQYGIIGLDLVIDGQSPTGAPILYEGVRIVGGSTHIYTQLYFNGITFIEGQQKISANQPPIFNLYDADGVPLEDALKYPNSNFTGSKIFNYSSQNTSVIDPYLGIPLLFSSFGDINFDNLLVTQRFTYTNNIVEEIPGYYYYRKTNRNSAESHFNDWHKSLRSSRQVVRDEYIIKGNLTSSGLIEFQRIYTLNITPDANISTEAYNSRIWLNGIKLVDGVDYTIIDNTLELSLSLDLKDNDILETALWAKTISSVAGTGYFEIPSNLSSNPNNEQIYTRSFNDIRQHLATIIANQTNIVGDSYGINNYNDTARDLSRGSTILNHQASMLRVGLLTGKDSLKLTNSIRYNNREYNTFKKKFLLKIQEFISTGYTASVPASVWVQDALNAINVGKSDTFPFAFSAMTSGNNYIPATASALGVTLTFVPSKFIDYTRLTPIEVIQGHDGSIMPAYNDFRDDVILELETQIYNNIDPAYNNSDRILEFDLFTIRPGYFRDTEYSVTEWNKVIQPGFERWAVNERIDYVSNRTFDELNPFTWNYSKCFAPNGAPVNGSWRGVFKYFYDTVTPNLTPWQMLGFSQMPSWWIAEYGPAPYTKDNSILWADLELGLIKYGTRAGTYAHLARPGLSALIPVDSMGEILDPVTIGLVSSAPNIVDAKANWKVGDIGPGEYNWRINSSYPFDLAEAMFLAKPAKFVDTFWEVSKLAREQGQLYNIDFLRRSTSADLFVHNEILTDGTRKTVKGISNWVSDYLTSQNLDIATNFGNIQRQLNSKLAYKSSAFLKSTNTRVVSDSFGVVPNENITTKLYKSSSVKQLVYSAIIVVWDGSNYRVSGYDSIAQKFTIIPGQETGPRTSVTVDAVKVERYDRAGNITRDIPYFSTMPNREAVYNFFIGYQRWLEGQGWVFEDIDTTNNLPKNFETSALQFLRWSQVPLTVGQSIIFSPISDNLVFQHDYGHIDNTGQFINGVYGILDRLGFGITQENFEITRSEDRFALSLKQASVQGVHCLRLSLVEFEHIIILDNITKFNDLIYDPIIGLRQPRFRLFANRTKFWNGKPLALGFIIQEDNLIDNFENSVDNFRRFFDFDWQPATGIQNELAQHLIGFQERNYMINLLLDTKSEFDFYKGLIRNKGTKTSFDNILRSSYITKTANFDILEEWAFEIGEYGNTERKSAIEMQALQSNYVTNPQIVEFVNAPGTDTSIIDMTPSDGRWVLKRKNNTTNNQFKSRGLTNLYREDLPSAGYVLVGETTYNIVKESNLSNLFNTVVFDNSSTFAEGTTIWTYILTNGGWDVNRICKSAAIADISLGINAGDPTVITTSSDHNLVVGDIIMFQSPLGSSPELQGIHTILTTPTSKTFTIEETLSTPINFTTIVRGSITNPTPNIGDILTINGTGVTLTGVSLAQTVIDINTAAISNIIASDSLGVLELVNIAGATITIVGSALPHFGFNESVALGTITNPSYPGSKLLVINGTTINLTGADLDTAIFDINSDSTMISTGIVASNIENKLAITSTYNDPITISGNGVPYFGLPSPIASSVYSGTGTAGSINVYVLRSVRFNNFADRTANPPVGGWLTGDKSFVDDNGSGLWEVSHWNGSTWIIDRTQNEKINIDDVYNVFLYDTITNQDIIELELYDPFKGLIFSSADAEIYYKLDFDPAKYTSGDSTIYQVDQDQSWGSEQKGRLWWDLRTTRFLDYEQSTLEYRKKYWGKVAPGITVDVYEWVESTVPPSSWDSYVTSQISAGANRPSGTPIYDVDTPYSEVEFFNTAKNITEKKYYFWVKNATTIAEGITFRNLSAQSVAQLIEQGPQQEIVWFAPIDTNAFVVGNADTFINDESSILQITFYEKEDESTIHKQWHLLREQDTNAAPYSPLWNKMRDSIVGFDDLNNIVPDTTLSPVERFGTKFRPRQTWFKNRLQARLEFFEKINKILLANNVINIVGWDTNLYQEEQQPDVTQYDYSVFNRADRDALNGTILSGKKVLVQHDEKLNNFWSLWLYNGGTSWTLIDKQLYKIEDYWNRVDWYLTGYNSSTRINYTFDTIALRNAAESSFLLGDIIKVLNNGTGVWDIYLFDRINGLPKYTLIAEEQGTIQFKTSLYSYDINDSYLDLQKSTSTKLIVSALQMDILTVLEQNSVFFTMVHYVHNEQTIVPWVFKTSLVLGQGIALPLERSVIVNQNLTNDLVSFFEEAKPYHVALRTLSEQKAPPIELANVQMIENQIIDLSLKLDRVTSTSAIPNGANPKDYDISKLNAADRVQLFYSPTEGMPPKVLESLISRSEFAGTILDGKTFYQFGTILAAGYDNSPIDYDQLGGYDFDTADLENFYDIYVNGGDPLNQAQTFAGGPTLNSSIVVDANKFIQPELNENHPEELIPVRVGDSLSIDVYTLDQPLNAEGFDSVPYDDFTTYDALGTAINPSFSIGDTIIINGYTIIASGTTLDELVDDINGYHDLIDTQDQPLILQGILASNNGGQLQISQAGPNISLIFGGTIKPIAGLSDITTTIAQQGAYDAASTYPAPDPSKTMAFRLFKNIFGNYQYSRISNFNSALLTAPLLSTDKEIVIDNASNFGIPDVASNSPGIAFIHGERIVFWEIDISAGIGNHKLKQCMRGTNGSGINPNLPIGTAVRDASKDQDIQGGLQWEYTVGGLQTSTSIMAEFLKLQAGTSDYGL